ncbi:ATP-binding cassette domain-containing protein [Streptomyces sp. NPDC019531]|uniref:ATP-binding cassette domain-containing protein n=1 Tax=Streptomyces sp. NPDC019531 TaxID=3365062 RepID=UPI00384FD661
MQRVVSGLRDWAAPLGLLRLLPRPLLAVLVLMRLVQALAPLAVTLTSAEVVGRATSAFGDELRGPLTAVAVLGVVLLVQQLSGLVVEPVFRLAVSSIDGAFRRSVAVLALTPTGIGHLEDKQLSDSFSTATTDLGGATPGFAACAQLTLVFRMASGFGSAVILAQVSLWAAVVVTVLLILSRTASERLFVGMNWVWLRSFGQMRRSMYWGSLLSGPEAAKETRVFGLLPWAVGRYNAEAHTVMAPVWQARTRTIVGNWQVVLTDSAAIFVGLLGLLLVKDAAQDPRTLASYVTALWAATTIGSLGFEGFSVAYGRPALLAARELRGELGLDTSWRAVTSAAPEQRPSPVPLAPRATPPLVRFEDVHFGYGGLERPVLQGMDLEISPGEVLAIVGVNGVGKTTSAKLLARLHDPVLGRITADGIDVASIPSAEWRRNLAVVFQGFVHYDLSLRQNIVMGAPERLQDTAFFERVAPELKLDDLVADLPGGWDTPLSRLHTGGAELSGGQWQRVALGRAVFALRAGRRILVLDEPTAHLDVEAEFEVFRHVIAAARGATVILVSHRLSTVRLADRIAVISDGRVTECGTHDALIADGLDYAEMFHMQASQYLTEPHRTPHATEEAAP